MNRRNRLLSLFFFLSIVLGLPLHAQNVSINEHGKSMETVFKELVRSAGKNYVYKSDLLKGLTVSISAKDEPLNSVLRRMFEGTDIAFTISGNNVILRRVALPSVRKIVVGGHVTEAFTSEPLVGALVALEGTNVGVFTNSSGVYSIHIPQGEQTLRISYPGFLSKAVRVNASRQSYVNVALSQDSAGGTSLKEVVVTADINHSIAMRSSDVGRLSLNVSDIRNTPVIFGESDVIKTLQMQPGVSQGIEGMAGLYVHGGTPDENLILLDGVPLYEPTHFGGLFSTFNVDIVKNVDFYKSSFPASYGGRLSSVLDVHTKDGRTGGHHGSLRFGLTSGAFNIDGPIGRATTYSFAIRRSWYDVLTIPGLAIYNHFREDKENKTVAGYAFMDINAKVTHRFSKGGRLYGLFYYGDDYLRGGEKREDLWSVDDETSQTSSDISRLHWGNILGSAGFTQPFSSSLFGDFSLSVSHFMSSVKRDSETNDYLRPSGELLYQNRRNMETANSITDLIGKAAFTWNISSAQRLDFGLQYTHHWFKPQDEATSVFNGQDTFASDFTYYDLTAHEAALYVSDDWDISGPVRLDMGLRGGLYSCEGPSHFTLDPRVGVRWAINDFWTLKASYASMTQYVRQLRESVLALPTDRWIPVTGDLKPQRSYNLSMGVYWAFGDGYTFSAEGYWRWLRNLADYPDYYYLAPVDTPWYDLPCQGQGRSRGLDFALTKSFGKLSGHMAYSLMWSDRRFDLKNKGEWFPDRFDNRHKINISVSWKVNDRWTLNALWTGMSGNRYTLQTQNYEPLPDPDMPFIDTEWSGKPDLVININGRRLPFYHRLDLSAILRTRHGEWTFSLFNAYCNMNPVAVRKRSWINSRTEFQYFRLLPAIPGVSYTWFF